MKVFAIDFVDTLLKGERRLLALGTQYVYRNLLFIAASLWAMVTSSRWYHGTFAVVGTLYLLFWLYAEYYLFNL